MVLPLALLAVLASVVQGRELQVMTSLKSCYDCVLD